MDKEGKAKLQLGKLTTLRDELRHEIQKAKATARQFSPEEIEAMTNYYREANRKSHQSPMSNLSGAERDQLLRHVTFQGGEPTADFARTEMDELDAYYRQVNQQRQQPTPEREM